MIFRYDFLFDFKVKKLTLTFSFYYSLLADLNVQQSSGTCVIFCLKELVHSWVKFITDIFPTLVKNPNTVHWRIHYIYADQ